MYRNGRSVRPFLQSATEGNTRVSIRSSQITPCRVFFRPGFCNGTGIACPHFKDVQVSLQINFWELEHHYIWSCWRWGSDHSTYKRPLKYNPLAIWGLPILLTEIGLQKWASAFFFLKKFILYSDNKNSFLRWIQMITSWFEFEVCTISFLAGYSQNCYFHCRAKWLFILLLDHSLYTISNDMKSIRDWIFTSKILKWIFPLWQIQLLWTLRPSNKEPYVIVGLYVAATMAFEQLKLSISQLLTLCLSVAEGLLGVAC